MKFCFPFVFYFSFILTSFGQPPGLPFSKYFSSQEYQGGIQNFSIGQSSAGLIYVANNFGLLEYDGAVWRRYPLPNSTKVRDVLLDESGRILVAGQGEFGYYRIDSNGKFIYHSLIPKLPSAYHNLEEVWKIFKVQDDVVFCTLNEIFVFSGDLKFKTVIKGAPHFESFHSLNNQLVLNQENKGLQLIQNEGLINIEAGETFGNKKVTGVITLLNAKKLVFTRDYGIFLLSGSTVSPWGIPGLSELRINKAVRLKNGDIVIGTQMHGIYILDESGNIMLHMNESNGLKNNTILSIFEDVSGNLWLGHNNGISLLELSIPFRHINNFSGITGTGYDAHFYDGKIYYGTNNGLYVQQITPEYQNKISEIPGAMGHVYNITEINNKLLIGHNDGAFILKHETAQPTEDFPGVWNMQPLKDAPGLVLSGSYTGLNLYELTDEELKFKRKIKGFKESSRIIEQDQDGTIWITHGYKGVFKARLNPDLDSVEVKFYGHQEGLPTNLLISVWRINNLLIFSTEYGIYTYNSIKDRFEKDPVFESYFGDLLITSMVEDPLGNIFYIGENEVGVLEKQINGTYIKNHQDFNKIIHLLNDDLQNVSLIRANEVLFAAKEGFIWYKLNDKVASSPSFPTIIRSVYLTGSADSVLSYGNYRNAATSDSNSTAFPQIPYKSGNIRFEYSNPIPNKENPTQFQYWLEGQEEGFGEWTTKRDKAYTNLPEGKYVFHVRSKNLYEQVGDEDTYAFAILPPWYRSFWAIGVYIILGLVSIWFLYTIIEKKYQKKTILITDAQTKELQKKEVALQSSKEEIEKLRTEKLESEIQNKNKELASATMHLINKNGFIDHVKTHVSTIITKSKSDEVKKELHKVIQSIDENIAGDNDWEQFEIHFDQVHGDFITRFKKEYDSLSPQEIKLSAYLRMNLSSKEIAYLMNISTRGVEIARYRLRKKLNLNRNENLQEFILKF